MQGAGMFFLNRTCPEVEIFPLRDSPYLVQIILHDNDLKVGVVFPLFY